MVTSTTDPPEEHFQVGDLQIDTARQTVAQNGVEIALPRLSYELLLALVRAHPRMLSNDDLMSSVWAPAIVNPETVSQRVKLLKHSLGEDPADPKYILGIRGRGYRMAVPVTRIPPSTPQPVDHELKTSVTTLLPEAPTSEGFNSLRRGILVGGGVAGLIALVAAFWYLRWPSHEAKPAKVESSAIGVPATTTSLPDKSIVVLPFLDMSERKDQAYFADGITEEVTSMLSHATDLRVSARTSAFYFKDHPTPVEQIGKTLGVANVLEGSVRKAGDKIRITVQLVRSDTGYHLWSASYDRKPSDVLATQSDIARAVVRALEASLDVDQPFTFKEVLSTNPEARALYFQAVWLMLPGDENGQKKARGLLQRAVALDPKFAQAWAILSVARVNTMNGVGAAPVAVRPGAYDAAERALRLDPQLGYSHAAMANVLLNIDWNSNGALAEVQRALELDPNNTLALLLASAMKLNSGHYAEAERLARELLRREPLSPLNYFNLAHVLWFSGKVTEAIPNYQAVVATNPAFADGHIELGIARLSAGDARGALAEVSQGKNADFKQVIHPWILDAMGQHAQAEREQALVERKYGDFPAYGYAIFYANRGNADKAFEWLDRDYQRNHDAELLTIKGDPMLKNLRSDPRFQALVQKLHLPD
jgi:TolB-like protein/DNA-binding winged helix-turn-helix (wHTH) protein/tetratricopeptide (TPR) repeat protein